MTRQDMRKKEVFQFRIDEDLKEKAKEIAEERKTTLSEVLNNFIKQWVKENSIR